MNENDVNRFLDAAKTTPYYQLFYLSLFTGLRRSEILALRWSDLDLPLCQAYVTRGLHHLQTGEIVFTPPKSEKSRRMVPLSPSTAQLLQQFKDRQTEERTAAALVLKDDDLVLKENDLVFSDINGKPLLPDSVTHAWIKLVRHNGLNGIRLQDARHSHATILFKQGVHPKIVQERLGHSSIQLTLDTYSHHVPGLQEAAAMGFDKVLLQQCEKESVKEN